MGIEEGVIGKECRFAIHMPTKFHDSPDLHLVKEVLHFKDGTTKPNVTFKRNYKRTFGVTAKPYRNHEQKKEYETHDKLMIYSCTQSELAKKAGTALERFGYVHLKKLAESPYLYGSDITSTAIVKRDYAVDYPDFNTPYSIAYFDIETDMIHGTELPIAATIIFGKKIFITVVRKLIEGYTNPEERFFAMVNKHIKPYMDKSGYEIEFMICENDLGVVCEPIKKAHEWSPDFVAIWNINFDIPKVLATIESHGVDPRDVFSDPQIPKSRRFCEYKKGTVVKKTASGGHKPMAPSEQWHSLLCPAGFYVICAMSSYRFVRQGDQELPYYKLNYVLDKELGIRKLNFKEADGIDESSPDWHMFMQERYPFEYLVYNIFDCIGMKELEESTDDLSMKVPIQCGFTDFAKFNSQGKKFSDDYNFFLEERGMMIGTVAPKPKEGAAEDDDTEEVIDDGTSEYDYTDDTEYNEDADEDVSLRNEILSLRQWIVTLPAHMSMLGLKLIDGMKSIFTLIRCFVYDSDAVSAYPSATAVANVSRETTVREIIEILGVDEEDFRRQNINLLQGHVNALEYVEVMHSLPRPQDALKLFDDLVA